MRAIGLMKQGGPEVLELIEVAGEVGFEPTVHGIKTRGYCYQELSGFS